MSDLVREHWCLEKVQRSQEIATDFVRFALQDAAPSIPHQLKCRSCEEVHSWKHGEVYSKKVKMLELVANSAILYNSNKDAKTPSLGSLQHIVGAFRSTKTSSEVQEKIFEELGEASKQFKIRKLLTHQTQAPCMPPKKQQCLGPMILF